MLPTICTLEVLVGRVKEMSMYMHHCGLGIIWSYIWQVVMCKSIYINIISIIILEFVMLNMYMRG